MNIQLSPLAAAKLKLILMEENTEHPLAVRVIPLTSGCSTPSFAIELTEVRPEFETQAVEDIVFAWLPQEAAWMDGLVIDLNRENGKFSIYHPNPPFMSDCQLDMK
ncbi:iron-sulfur cluster biosynthesis family protein [Thermoflavimicrobium dichotomicum]|uniref:Fe-S cluster assembly iron-binding protein IscA n=1 Tax=Thermoflavimicrobium dichotomicum TaxID=46223 RepID=A0A1I3RM34_9BACL|nr:iron-sulfur cluster biosynthesis family protein [Thermoflavimicrobium dichotomicum]SFJ47375.1 Fe-S cluster assembly iron-binding protein IscA [Thermoflavimicrobium dichotomicum]